MFPAATVAGVTALDHIAVTASSDPDNDVDHDPQRARGGASRLARPRRAAWAQREAEIRDILEQAAKPEGRLKPGSLLTSIAGEAGGLSDAEADRFDALRDRTPGEPMLFE